MLSNLNEQQKAAVLAVEGPVMVFAGAGSGKTRTLTYRVAYMIDACNIKPYNILAITFTKKATNEMKERLIELIGPFAYDVTDRKSTRLNSSHVRISYAVFCLKK